jgi:glycosyltransferase involved in cell wall biosynthesis
MGGARAGAASANEHAEADLEPRFSAARRVTFITPYWARNGGVGAHVLESAALLARAGVDVQVLAAQVVSEERPPGVVVAREPELMERGTDVMRRLSSVLAHEPDIVHLHQVDEPEIVEAVRERAAVVMSAHGYTACTSGVHYFGPGEGCTRHHGPGCVVHLPRCAHVRNPTSLPRRYRAATRGLSALQRADLAVSYSSAVDRHLSVNGVRHRAIVPYFPTVPADLAGVSPIDREGAPAASSPPRVLFVGRVVAAKGAGVLLRAAREVSDAEFVIAGSGRQLPAMRKLAQRLGLAERVRFAGWLGPRELASELRGAAVAVVPSVWPEPFGIVGIEAHAAGVPVIASATGGISDWLDDGVNGLLVPAGDAPALARALSDLLADHERRRAMGQAGRRSTAARFSAELHLAALERAYAVALEARDARMPAPITSARLAQRAAAG